MKLEDAQSWSRSHLQPLTNFLMDHWRIVLALVVLAATFFAGRFTVPTKVITDTKTEFKDRVVEVEKRIVVKANDQKVVVYRDRVTKPDGTTIEHEESRTVTRERETELDDKATQRDTTGSTSTHSEVSTIVPQWRAGVLLGLDARDVRLLPVPSVGKPVVGGLLERRLIGGLSASAWVLSSGPTVGVGLTYEF